MAASAVSSLFRSITGFLIRDDAELKAQLAEMKTALRLRNAENARLRRKVKRDAGSAKMKPVSPVNCDILYYDPAGASYVILLNVGSKQGVKEGMALCSGRVAVGRIYTASSGVSIAVLHKHPKCRFPVVLEPGGAKGIAYGTGKGVEIRFVPIEADVKRNYLVLTSGDTGFVPKGLLVGVVKLAKRDESRLVWKIEMEIPDESLALEELYVAGGLNGNDDLHIPRALK